MSAVIELLKSKKEFRVADLAEKDALSNLVKELAAIPENDSEKGVLDENEIYQDNILKVLSYLYLKKREEDIENLKKLLTLLGL